MQRIRDQTLTAVSDFTAVSAFAAASAFIGHNVYLRFILAVTCHGITLNTASTNIPSICQNTPTWANQKNSKATKCAKMQFATKLTAA
jgi:hypothetical protein